MEDVLGSITTLVTADYLCLEKREELLFHSLDLLRIPESHSVIAFSRSKEAWNIYLPLKGRVRFQAVKQHPTEPLAYHATILSSMSPHRYLIPPGWWFGFETLTPDVELLQIRTESGMDEVVSPNTFSQDAVWRIHETLR